MKTPAVIFCFNRDTELRQTLENIELARQCRDREYYFFVDGPRDILDRRKIDMVLASIEAFSSMGFNITVVERDRNLGLRRNIISGLSEVFKKHSRAIIIEDDILVTASFFEFMDEMLNRYEGSPKIASINGWAPRSSRLSYYYASDTFQCWGWATWDYVWRDYIRDPNIVQKFSRIYLRMFFDKCYTQNYTEQLQMNHSGTKDTWAVYFAFLVWANGLRCISSSTPLTQNIGFTNPTNTFVKIHQPAPTEMVPKLNLTGISFIINLVNFLLNFGNKTVVRMRAFLT